ncbi:MAG: MBL fold metallo-hydrolase RNA specificity domain-containing protein, partial [Armatimonadota bacterium]
EEAMRFFEPAPYNETVELCPGVRARFLDAGHILGSATVEVWVTENGRETKIVFSGDVGRPGRPILRDPTVAESADVLLIESTYGNRIHDTVPEPTQALFNIVNATRSVGGRVIIPSFAVGRTQAIIYELNALVESGRLPVIPTYIDSPLAVEATRVFRRHRECFDGGALQRLSRGDDPFEFPGLHLVTTTADSQRLNDMQEPAIIISASGMCTAGRIRHHIKHNIGDSRNTILFVGYQAENTLGRKLRDGAEYIKLFGERRRVRAKIEALDGFSAHADQSELLEWLSGMRERPKVVFTVHGETPCALTLAYCIGRRIGIPAYAPELYETLDLGQLDALTARAEEQRAIFAASLPEGEDGFPCPVCLSPAEDTHGEQEPSDWEETAQAPRTVHR